MRRPVPFRTALAACLVACAVTLAVTLVAFGGEEVADDVGCIKAPAPDTKLCIVSQGRQHYKVVCIARAAGGGWHECGPRRMPVSARPS